MENKELIFALSTCSKHFFSLLKKSSGFFLEYETCVMRNITHGNHSALLLLSINCNWCFMCIGHIKWKLRIQALLKVLADLLRTVFLLKKS